MAQNLVADIPGQFQKGRQFAMQGELQREQLQNEQFRGMQQQRLAPIQFQQAQANLQAAKQANLANIDKDAFARTVQTALELRATPDDQKAALLERKIMQGESLGRDMAQTRKALELVNSGQINELMSGADQLINVGERMGVISPVASANIEVEKLKQRRVEHEFRQQQAKAKAGELSPTVQKILDSAQTASIDAGQRARSLTVLADDINKLDIGGGLAASTSETLKNILGTQNDVSELRRRFNSVRASQATQNLPPGPASDKDILLALSGFPKENASGRQIESFLRGAAKLESIDSAFQAFKSDLISETRSTKGLLKKWKATVGFSQILGREIKTSELFITAQEEGMTIEDLKEQLGINNG